MADGGCKLLFLWTRKLELGLITKVCYEQLHLNSCNNSAPAAFSKLRLNRHSDDIMLIWPSSAVCPLTKPTPRDLSSDNWTWMQNILGPPPQKLSAKTTAGKSKWASIEF